MNETNKNNRQKQNFSSVEDEYIFQHSHNDIMYHINNESQRIIEEIKTEIQHKADDIMQNDNDSTIEKDEEIGQNIIMDNANSEKKKLFNFKFDTPEQILSAIALIIAGLGIMLTIALWSIDNNINAINKSFDTKIDAVNDNVNAKFETISTKIDAINQRLDYQEKLNTIQIQRDVANEVKNQRLGK